VFIPDPMRPLLLFLLFLLVHAVHGQTMTLAEWDERSKTDKRLLPKYGHLVKSAAELRSDSSFVQEIMSQEQFGGDRRKASDHLIGLGFNYLYRNDVRTAMNRFN
jgi:hypothetical protein